MLINPRRAKLESELADIDQELQAVSNSFLLSNGQKVLHTSHLQHQRQKKSLEVEIFEQEAKLESCGRDVEEQQKRYEWAQSPTGRAGLRRQEIRRLAASALGTYSPSDTLNPEQRALERVRNGLGLKEEALRNAKSKLAKAKLQLWGLQAQDAEWDELLEKDGPKGLVTTTSDEFEFQLRLQRGADALERAAINRSKVIPTERPSVVHCVTQAPRPIKPLRGSRHILAPAAMPAAVEDEAPIFSSSDSCQKIHFRGKDYDLTRHPRAASVVRVLREAHNRGERRVSTAMIRAGINLKHGGKMYDWFRQTGLWKTLVVEVETGVYQLDIPLTNR